MLAKPEEIAKEVAEAAVTAASNPSIRDDLRPAYAAAFAAVHSHFVCDVTTAVSLRTEIIESQKAFGDFLKWKLIAVAAIAAAAFGLGQNTPPQPYLLILIPFVCVYTDLFCSARLKQAYAIGAYLRKVREDPYEVAIEEIRNTVFKKKGFHSDRLALCFTSILVDVFALAGGWCWALVSAQYTIPICVSVAGVLCIILHLVLFYRLGKCRDKLCHG
jgi:hypothetical protein